MKLEAKRADSSRFVEGNRQKRVVYVRKSEGASQFVSSRAELSVQARSSLRARQLLSIHPPPSFHPPAHRRPKSTLLQPTPAMNWLASLFSSSSSSSNESARRKLALSTHDAFSLPTSSPITASHPDSFSHSSPDAFDVDTLSPSTSSYAYPPPASPTTYDYLPRQKYALCRLVPAECI